MFHEVQVKSDTCIDHGGRGYDVGRLHFVCEVLEFGKSASLPIPAWNIICHLLPPPPPPPPPPACSLVGEFQHNKNANEQCVRTPSLPQLCFKTVSNVSIKSSSERKHIRLQISFASPLDVSPRGPVLCYCSLFDTYCKLISWRLLTSRYVQN